MNLSSAGSNLLLRRAQAAVLMSFDLALAVDVVVDWVQLVAVVAAVV